MGEEAPRPVVEAGALHGVDVSANGRSGPTSFAPDPFGMSASLLKGSTGQPVLSPNVGNVPFLD